jgi:hypothetical protein
MDVEDPQEVMKGRINFVCSKANLWNICDRIVRGEVLNQSKVKEQNVRARIQKSIHRNEILK